MIREALLCVVGTIPLVLAIAWLTTQFKYRITRTHLEVTLFGFKVRRLHLDAIRSMSARRLREGEWGEQWWNTLKPSRRFLTLKLNSGFFRFFVITPNHRYIFKAELKQAISELKGKAAAAAIDESDTDFLDADEDGEGGERGEGESAVPGVESQEGKTAGSRAAQD